MLPLRRLLRRLDHPGRQQHGCKRDGALLEKTSHRPRRATVYNARPRPLMFLHMLTSACKELLPVVFPSWHSTLQHD